MMFRAIFITYMLICLPSESKGNEISPAILKLEENFSDCDVSLDKLASFCDENPKDKKCQTAQYQTNYLELYSENLFCYQKIMKTIIHDFYSAEQGLYTNYFNSYAAAVSHLYKELYFNALCGTKQPAKKMLLVRHNISFDIHNFIENILDNIKFKQASSLPPINKKILLQETLDLPLIHKLNECNKKIDEQISFCSQSANFSKPECFSPHAMERQINKAKQARHCYRQQFNNIVQMHFAQNHKQIINAYDEYVAKTVEAYETFYFPKIAIPKSYGLTDILGCDLKINAQIFSMIDNFLNNMNNNCK